MWQYTIRILSLYQISVNKILRYWHLFDQIGSIESIKRDLSGILVRWLCNSNDVLLEQLSDNGNGTYSYVNNLKEAKRLFVDHLTSTLQFIALDIDIQGDFNPDVVVYTEINGNFNTWNLAQSFESADLRYQLAVVVA